MRPTEAKQLVELMVAQDWTVDRTANGHYVGKHPGGKGMVTFADSRDPSAIKNATFQARRAGLRIDNTPEKEKAVADKTETDNSLIRRKRVLLEKCEVTLSGKQLADAIRQYIQKQTGVYPAQGTILIVNENGDAATPEDVEVNLEWSQERAVKEGEVV